MPETTTDNRSNDDAVREARAIYQRVLSGWAMDVLTLRREGLDKPTFRGIDDAPEGAAWRQAA